jgi:chemosensory pili system protein ChpA (sensor histidine kinase/response regulator)
MTSFGLDEVREPFSKDVARFATGIDTGARRILSSISQMPSGRPSWEEPIDTMVIGLHGIAGSSSLIGLDSLTVPAQRLEVMARMAQQSLAVIQHHLQRIKKISVACIEGASDLKHVVLHELDGKSQAAQSKSEAALKKIATVEDEIRVFDNNASDSVKSAATRVSTDVQAPSALSPASSITTPVKKPAPAKIAIPPIAPKAAIAAPATTDDSWDASASSDPSGDQDELQAAFIAEARTTLISLQGYWSAFEGDANNGSAIEQCLRLLHLLQGAAASVGKDTVASQAADLGSEMQQSLRSGAFSNDRGQTLSLFRSLLNELTGSVVPELQLLSSPLPASASVVSPAMTVDEDDSKQIFMSEAREAFAEIQQAMSQVERGTELERGVAIGRIDRLFHRLKGSALIVGESDTAELFSRGQTICEELEHIDVAALRVLVNDIAKNLGVDAPSYIGADSSARTAAVASPHRERFSRPNEEEWSVFQEEASSLIEELNSLLARLESSSNVRSELATMFRIYHTLKGAAYSVGLNLVGRQLHAIEDQLEKLVASSQTLNLRALVTALAIEHRTTRTAISRAGSDEWVELDVDATKRNLLSVTTAASQTDTGNVAKTNSSWIAASDPVWHSSSVDESPSRHSAPSQASDANSRDDISKDDDGATDAGVERRFVRVAADKLDGLLNHVGELVIARSRILSRVKRMQDMHFEDLHQHGAVARLINDFATSTQFANLDGTATERRGQGRSMARPRAMPRATTPSARDEHNFGALELDRYEDIHVLSRQLDEATSDITEIRRLLSSEMQELQQDTEALNSAVSELQTEITLARMITVESLFTRLQLPIRDAAQRHGRTVVIETRGDDASIDKVASDVMFGPLLHMVRNAVVHGIEAADVRAAAGKGPEGKIVLAARQEQGQVVIEISDDGAGIDLAALRAAGIAAGKIDDTVTETDPRVVDLIFAHGVSTARGADDVAGRGVGGNVIRRAVDRLNGSIDVVTNPQRGTMFRISLPLSMSITQAVLLRSSAVTFAIPIAFAESIVATNAVSTVQSFGRTRAKVGPHLVPLFDSRKLFPDHGDLERRTTSVVVVCLVGNARVGIVADEVVGQEEIVIKSLGEILEGHAIFSGSTQRGDGELALLLDVPGVLATEVGVATGNQTTAIATPADVDITVKTEVAVDAALTTTTSSGVILTSLIPLNAGKLRVLFVDDSLSVRKVGERMLLGLGVDVITAVDGLDALEKLRTMAFSMVFTDLEMPKMHGFELIAQMQFVPAYRELPIVVISSRSGKKHVDQAVAVGARECLTKPFSPEVLNDILQRYVGKVG